MDRYKSIEDTIVEIIKNEIIGNNTVVSKESALKLIRIGFRACRGIMLGMSEDELIKMIVTDGNGSN